MHDDQSDNAAHTQNITGGNIWPNLAMHKNTFF